MFVGKVARELQVLAKPSFQWLQQAPLIANVSRKVAAYAMMSVAVSSSQKALESPFSHREFFGMEHPVHNKGKGKSQKRKKSKHSRSKSPPMTTKKPHHQVKHSVSVASVTSNGSSRHKKKPSRHSKMTIHTSTEQATRVPSSTGTTVSRLLSPPLDLPKVEAADSPKVERNSETTAAGAGVRRERVNGMWNGGAESDSNPTGSHSSRDIETPIPHSRSSSTVSSVSTISLKSSVPPLLNSAINIRFDRSSTPHHIRPAVRRAFESSAQQLSRTFSSHRRPGIKDDPLTVADIASGLAKRRFRHVVLMSGAGISTPSGIADFRTPGTGLYDNLQQYKIPEPAAIFDLSYFSLHPQPFLALARELYPGRYTPNVVHCFVRLLQEQGLLLRNYTQNIDGLERLAGVKPGKLVEAHGSFSTASCIRCHSQQDPSTVKKVIFEGKVPHCKHKHCLGLVKPDVVFFGEELPQRFHNLQQPDFSRCDLLIVMGTSLEVEPFASLANLPRYDVPRLLLNRETVGPFKQHRQRRTDVAVIGDLVGSVWELARSAGWEEELQELVRASCDGGGRGEGGEGGGGVRSYSTVAIATSGAVLTSEADGSQSREQPPATTTHRDAHGTVTATTTDPEGNRDEAAVIHNTHTIDTISQTSSTTQTEGHQEKDSHHYRSSPDHTLSPPPPPLSPPPPPNGSCGPLHTSMLGLSLSDKKPPTTAASRPADETPGSFCNKQAPLKTLQPHSTRLQSDLHPPVYLQSHAANSKLEQEKLEATELRSSGMNGVKESIIARGGGGLNVRTKPTASWSFGTRESFPTKAGKMGRLEWRVNYFYSGLHKS